MTGLGLKSALLLFVVCFVGMDTLPVEQDMELILVHVIFRHGQRTTYKFYPTDPYKNETFYPIGLGGLTNKGKMMEYQLGKFIRKLYGNFLGDTYTEEILKVRSSNTQRTRMSALLVLAGLWPPSKVQEWNSHMPWIPIPVDYKRVEDVISPSNCNARNNILNDLPNRPEVQENFINPYKELFNYLETHSGMSVNNLQDLLELYFILNTEDEMGLKLPEWTANIYPEPLYSTASRVYEYLNFDPQVRSINTGFLLTEIFTDSAIKVLEPLVNKKTKMYLYSGHETTLGYFLNALKLTEPHIPAYSSAIFVEIYRRGTDLFVKLRYKRSTDDSQVEDLVLPGCDVFCPLIYFMEIIQPILPGNTFEEMCAMVRE